MLVKREDFYVGRVLSEDDDFVLLEVGKHDGVTFHLQQDETGETVGGDKFFTILFNRQNPATGKTEVWKPFQKGDT